MNRRVVLRATAATAGFLLGLVLAQAAVARERSTLPASGAEVARGVESVPDAFEERVRVAVERILGAVGTITAHASRGPRFGSAVVVDREVGLVVTSHHVVAGATKILFQPETGGPVEADLVRVDGDADLALLRARPAPHAPGDAPDVLREEPAAASLSLPSAVPVSSRPAYRGQLVIVAGSPDGLAQTAALGMVSSLRVSLPDLEPGAPLIQVDAPVAGGSSGGPVCGLGGEVLGIVTRRAASGATAFAAPADRVVRLLDDYRAGRPATAAQDTVAAALESPTPPPATTEPAAAAAVATPEATTPAAGPSAAPPVAGFLGAELQPLTAPWAEHLRYAGRGVLVAAVFPSSPAEAAGLAPGDVLVAVDGGEVAASTDGQIPIAEARLAGTAPGEHALTIVREGKRIDLVAAFAAEPPCRVESIASRRLSAAVQGTRRCYWLPEGEFVHVTRSLEPARGAEGLREGDLVVSLAGSDTVAEGLRRWAAERPRGALVARVLRDGRPRLVLLAGPRAHPSPSRG